MENDCRFNSVNSGINQGLCSLSYASIDEAVQVILQLGQGPSLVKLDLKDVYCIIEVRPAADDHYLLGMQFTLIAHFHLDCNQPLYYFLLLLILLHGCCIGGALAMCYIT